MGQIQPAASFCMAYKLRISFYILNHWNKWKKDFSMHENDIQFKFQWLQSSLRTRPHCTWSTLATSPISMTLPTGLLANTQTLDPPWPLYSGGLCLPHFLQGSAQTKPNQRSLPHPSLSVSSSCLIFLMAPITPDLLDLCIACLHLPYCKFHESWNIALLPAAFLASRHSRCSTEKWIVEYWKILTRGKGDPFWTRTSQPLKAFMMWLWWSLLFMIFAL